MWSVQNKTHVIDAENTSRDSGERCSDLNCVLPIIVSRKFGGSNFSNSTSESKSHQSRSPKIFPMHLEDKWQTVMTVTLSFSSATGVYSMTWEMTKIESLACELWKRSENSSGIRQRMEMSKIKHEREKKKRCKECRA